MSGATPVASLGWRCAEQQLHALRKQRLWLNESIALWCLQPCRVSPTEALLLKASAGSSRAPGSGLGVANVAVRPATQNLAAALAATTSAPAAAPQEEDSTLAVPPAATGAAADQQPEEPGAPAPDAAAAATGESAAGEAVAAAGALSLQVWVRRCQSIPDMGCLEGGVPDPPTVVATAVCSRLHPPPLSLSSS